METQETGKMKPEQAIMGSKILAVVGLVMLIGMVAGVVEVKKLVS